MNKNNRAFLLIGLLFLIFAGPLIVAYFLFSERSFVPPTLNYGRLIQPILPLKELPLFAKDGQAFDQKQLQNYWLFVYVNPTECETFCEDNLYKMRQVRKATGKNQEQVGRAILTIKGKTTPILDKLLATEYQGTLHLTVDRQDLERFLQGQPSKDLALSRGTLYLVDPFGNVMMSYKADEDPENILADIRRLLKVSQVS